jgi:cellobiose-specific phosphotransferase system component IIB
VTLSVISLKNIPEDFTNAIGEFEFEAVLTKSEISMNESSTLTLSITGTGDAKAIEIPNMNGLLSHFEVYEPTINSVVKEETSRLITQKIFTYLLVPKRTGKLSYTPSFTYFDTNTKDFETLESKAFNFTIKKGSENRGTDEIKSFADDGERDIHTIFATTNFRQGKPNFFSSVLFWGLIVLPFVGLLVALNIKQKQQKEAAINPMLSKMSKADKVAMQHLAKAENHWKNKEEQAFYEAISKALWGYVADKLVIPQAELSKENIRSKLAEKQVTIQNINHFMTVLNTSEMAVFAKLGTNMETVYNDAKTVIVTIEETLKG